MRVDRPGSLSRALCLACGLSATAAAMELDVHAPDAYTDRDGALIAEDGFLTRLDGKILMGDILRWDRGDDDLYAEGDIVCSLPQTQIHANRFGFHPEAGWGEAWELIAWVHTPKGRLVIEAEHLSITEHRLVFDGVRFSGGNGGVFAVPCRRLVILFRDEPAADRSGIERQVAGIAVHGASLQAAGIPVFYMPYYYRDFELDYPWTRLRFGRESRIGSYLRYEIGSGIPAPGDLSLWIGLRGDLHSRTGEAFGVDGAWRHPRFGRGEATWYAMPHEIVRQADGTVLQHRRAEVFDVEHQVAFPGGGLSARWYDGPDADPPSPGTASDGLPPDERFRADFLRDDLEHRPFARRGVTAAFSGSMASVVVDTERHHHDYQMTSERSFGLQVRVPRSELFGGIHAGGDIWTEDLRRTSGDQRALRSNIDGGLFYAPRWGSLAWKSRVGIQGIDYHDAYRNGADRDNEARFVPYGISDLSLRWQADFESGISHAIEPFVGVEWRGPGHGDDLAAWSFGDGRDRLEEDLALGRLGFDTDVSGGGRAFSLGVTSRWSLSEEERRFNEDGQERRASHPLYDISLTATGKPTSWMHFTGNLRYDARRDQMAESDLGLDVRISSAATLRWNGSWNESASDPQQRWYHRFGTDLNGSRYSLSFDIDLRPEGDAIDGWGITSKRRMVDGELSIGFRLNRDANGDLSDQRFSIAFTTN